MSNKLIEFSLQNAENTVWTVVDMSVPLVTKFEDPINKIDDLMCKSLDLVEQNAPIVTYTPEEVNILFYSLHLFQLGIDNKRKILHYN